MSGDLSRLCEREREVLRLLARGHDVKSVAAGLGLSTGAVNKRLREARRKLGVSSSRGAARILAADEAILPAAATASPRVVATSPGRER